MPSSALVSRRTLLGQALGATVSSSAATRSAVGPISAVVSSAAATAAATSTTSLATQAASTASTAVLAAISPGVKLSAKGNDTRWAAGETAMSFIGGWQINAFINLALYKNDYTMATFPKGTASSPDQDTIQLAVGANIKDPTSAWNFMKWLLQDDRYANLVLRMPVLTADAVAWSKKAFARVPVTAGVDVLTSSLAIAQAPDPVRAIPANSQFDKTIAIPLWNNLLAQKVTVQDGLAQAQTQLQTLLDQTNK